MKFECWMLYNTVIFDRNNTNFEVKGENVAIERLFKDMFIPVVDDTEKIIGFIKNVGEWKESKLYGDILFWNVEYTDFDFKNYEVILDKSSENIVAVNSVTYSNDQEL